MTPEQVLSCCDRGVLWPADRVLPTELPAAYEAALRLRALREARGERVVGYKVGFTNRTIWERYQVFAPIWGPMWNTTVTHCDGEGVIALRATSLPRIEPEVVFGLARTPPRSPTLDELFACIEWIAPGFEIVQSHCDDWKFTAAETIADGALHARMLVGSKRPLAELASDASALDQRLAAAQLRLHRGDERVATGSGRDVLDSPLQALRHFVNAFREVPQSVDLRPGDIVTTGTWTDAWPIEPGQKWHLQLDLPLSPLHVEFR